MPSDANDLDSFLEELARTARPGDRLPTIRELMRRFDASQTRVQRAFRQLKDRGLIDSQVGRGTFFVGAVGTPGVPAAVPRRPPAPRPAAAGGRSVLLLRRSVSIMRGRALIDGLQSRFASEGCRVLELSYTDAEHARMVLDGLPRFDACVVQSTFKTIPIELLGALRERSDVLAVDGAALVGTDVESVGTEWGEPLAIAVERLCGRGHRRIAFATTTHPFLATELGRRRFESLCRARADVAFEPMLLPHLPDDPAYLAALVDALRAGRDASGRPRSGALVAWGVEDGARFRAELAESGIAVPSALSVVLLGRTDLVNEHADFFETVGCSIADQIATLHQAIHARWQNPGAPYGMRLTPVTLREGASVGDSPGKATRNPQR